MSRPVDFTTEDIKQLSAAFGPWSEIRPGRGFGIVEVNAIPSSATAITVTGSDREVRAALLAAVEDLIDAALSLGWEPFDAPRIDFDGEMTVSLKGHRQVVHKCELRIELRRVDTITDSEPS